MIQTNATLTAVTKKPGAATDAFQDSEEQAAAAIWSGTAEAYYMEQRERTSGLTAENLPVRRSLIVEEGVPTFAGGWQVDQIVAFTFNAVNYTGLVRKVERRKLAGMGPVQTTRLTLNDA